MIPLTLGEVAEATGGRVRAQDAGRRVTSVVTDSRRAEAGALFVALRGEHADGHDFVRDADGRGAVGHLTERDPPEVDGGVVVADTWAAIGRLGAEVRRRVDPTVVAVTGSVGKTTTKDLTAAALGAGRRTVAAEGSFNNELGVPLTLLACEADTEALVVEVGARGVGHIAALAPLIRPDVAVVTAVAAAHTELFGDLDAIARAKRELVEALDGDGTAVLNADDPRVDAMAGVRTGAVLRFGRGPGADVTAQDVRLDRLARPSFTARTPWGDAGVDLPLAGEHQVANALAALAVAGAVGVDVRGAAAALADAPVSPWRSQVVEADGVVVLNDAYNANPTSVEAALRTLVAVEHAGRTWAVLGYMAELGAGEDEDHRRMGRRAAELGVDRLVVVGGGAARALYDGAAAAGLEADRRFHVDDADAALRALRRRVGDGDVVLVKASRVAGLERVADGLVGAIVRGALT